jgi:N-acetylgalactosamine-N,N'-diacetylbacillosaminyl-diphospho-undecaprenol 4-alpha-N-acetylgalactosaminyltransferase
VGEEIFFYVHGSKIHDRNITGWLGWVRKFFLIPFFYSKAHSIFVVNRRLKDELIAHFRLSKSSFQLLPNFYDFDELNSLAGQTIPEEMSDWFKKYLTISISGRIAPEKGIDQFIRILPKLLQSIPTIKVVIIGDGPDKNLIKHICEEVGIRHQDTVEQRGILNSTVVFLGYQKNPYAYVSRSTILALPSRNEGMPNTIVEAMGLGVPVIASDCPYGPRELLSSDATASGAWPEFAEFGVLAPVLDGDSKSQDAWVQAVVALVESENLRMAYSEKGKMKCKGFSTETNLGEWKRLLRM